MFHITYSNQLESSRLASINQGVLLLTLYIREAKALCTFWGSTASMLSNASVRHFFSGARSSSAFWRTTSALSVLAPGPYCNKQGLQDV